MALKGNLRDFTITQLLNLINLAQKTGKLTLEQTGEEISVYFRTGKLAYAVSSSQDNSLVGILSEAGKLSTAQSRLIKERTTQISDKELGLLLINANYISQQDILSILQTKYLQVISRIFLWADGSFRFDNDLFPPEEKISLRLGLENIIIEGSRQVRELEQLQDEIPSLDMALKFSERPGTTIRNINLNKDEWRVVSFINPKNSLRQIARAVKLNDLEIRRIVYGLLQAGLVEIIRPLGSPPPVPSTSRSPLMTILGSKEERQSLINRLISRIRSL